MNCRYKWAKIKNNLRKINAPHLHEDHISQSGKILEIVKWDKEPEQDFASVLCKVEGGALWFYENEVIFLTELEKKILKKEVENG